MCLLHKQIRVNKSVTNAVPRLYDSYKPNWHTQTNNQQFKWENDLFCWHFKCTRFAFLHSTQSQMDCEPICVIGGFYANRPFFGRISAFISKGSFSWRDFRLKLLIKLLEIEFKFAALKQNEAISAYFLDCISDISELFRLEKSPGHEKMVNSIYENIQSMKCTFAI